MEDQDERMIPAALPAIRSLRTTRYQVKDIKNVQQCLVCQEDYCNGEKVSCMPCFHMFHSDCITKWLVKCHLCPVCKYQMPKYQMPKYSWLALVVYLFFEFDFTFKLKNRFYSNCTISYHVIIRSFEFVFNTISTVMLF